MNALKVTLDFRLILHYMRSDQFSVLFSAVTVSRISIQQQKIRVDRVMFIFIKTFLQDILRTLYLIQNRDKKII